MTQWLRITGKTLNVVTFLLSDLQEHFLLRTKLCIHGTKTTEIQQICDSPKVTGNQDQPGWIFRLQGWHGQTKCHLVSAEAPGHADHHNQQAATPTAPLPLACLGAGHSWGSHKHD